MYKRQVFKQTGLDLKGCNYVPLGLTAKEGMDNMWHTYADTLNNSSGLAITKSCEDVDAAFQFVNDILEQDIHDLRFWGVEGEDYLVDDDGLYYRTEDMRIQCADTEYKASHLCGYSYFPCLLYTSYARMARFFYQIPRIIILVRIFRSLPCKRISVM